MQQPPPPSTTIAGEELINFSLDENIDEIFAFGNADNNHHPMHDVGGNLADLNVFQGFLAPIEDHYGGGGQLSTIDFEVGKTLSSPTKRGRGRPPNPNKPVKAKRVPKYMKDPSGDKTVQQAIDARRNREEKKQKLIEMQEKIGKLEQKLEEKD